MEADKAGGRRVACPLCDTECDGEHGLRVHFGMVHPGLETVTPALQAAGVAIEDALAKLTDADAPMSPWQQADTAGELAGLLVSRGVALQGELAEQLDAVEATNGTPGHDVARFEATREWGFD